MWSYCTPSSNLTKAVVFEFSETRSGENVREFLRLNTPNAWKGTLVEACVSTSIVDSLCRWT